MKKFISLMFLFLMSAFSASTAIAAGGNSITISHIQNSKNQAIDGWNISVYEIATYDAGTFTYSVNKNYGDLIDVRFITEEKTANEISDKALEIQEHIRKSGVSATASSSSESGKVYFENLNEGIYIIIFSQRRDYNASPSLISVPGPDSSSVTVDAKIEDISHGGGGGNGGGNGGGHSSDDSPSNSDEEIENGDVLGVGRDLPVPEKKMVLGAGRTPQTGDESRMQLYLYLSVASMLLLISWMIIWFKKSRR